VPSSGTISLPGQPDLSFSLDPDGGYGYYHFAAGSAGGPVTINVTSGAGVIASERVS